MTETQQRFLRAIAERVPMGQVVELHLFPPIRQGGVETGVAVVAEDPRVVPPNGTAIDSVSANGAAPDEAHVADVMSNGTEPVVDTTSREPEAVADETVHEFSAVSDDDEPAPYADEVVADEEAAEENDVAEDDRPAAPPPRFTIHTARYRLTLKGVDRGKWEVDVVAEADAPLEAVDKVVRGVQRRSGEGAEPDRLSAEAFRQALDAPLATLER